MHEARAEALVALGHPAAGRPTPRTDGAGSHPYRERLWALLARAQYACARQADALATLARLRTSLAEDLGVDPSPLVRAMEQRILAQDPDSSYPPRSRRRPPHRLPPGSTGAVVRRRSQAASASRG